MSVSIMSPVIVCILLSEVNTCVTSHDELVLSEPSALNSS